MNQKLLTLFPNRTLEAIKGQRKRITYKTLVERLVHEMRPQPEEHRRNIITNPALSESDDLTHTEVRVTITFHLLETLTPCVSEMYDSKRLNEICQSCKH